MDAEITHLRGESAIEQVAQHRQDIIDTATVAVLAIFTHRTHRHDGLLDEPAQRRDIRGRAVCG
ncbi:MAG: hypothetical protein H0W83_07655 [Planctomycetes bacterium]|nr:hypothetical protein [Planctomycetota bacterium]